MIGYLGTAYLVLGIVAAFIFGYSARKMIMPTRSYEYRVDRNGNEVVIDLNQPDSEYSGN